MGEPILIDGTIGGGSVLRVGVPLAMALNRPIEIINVRQHRKKKGLRTQHLTGLQLLSQLTGSMLDGAAIGSSHVRAIPNQMFVAPNQHPMIQLPTSAAVSLVIQTISNYVFASGKPLGFDFVGGGTHVNWSPNFDVLMGVNKPLFEKFGLRLHIQLRKPGFYPCGGAMGRIYMEPLTKSQVFLETGEVEGIDLYSNASTSLRTEKVVEKQVSGFKSIIKDIDNLSAGYAEADCPGSACSAIIRLESGSAKAVARVGQPGLDPIDVGRRTAKAAKDEISHQGSVDEQLADQLILPLAFMPSGSGYTFERIFPHIDANIKVVQQILGDVISMTKEDNRLKFEKV